MRRMLCALIAVSILLLALPVSARATPEGGASATPPAIPTTGDVWDGSIEQPTKIVNKDGVNYYKITKCSQLAFVAQTGGDWLGRNYLLANDLILNDVVFEWGEDGVLKTDTSTLNHWTPIGQDYNDSFTGIFDGNGYTVSGLFIDSFHGSFAGLFGHGKGTVRALNLVNVSILSNAYNDCSGGISGYMTTVSNCSFAGVLSGLCFAGGICGSADLVSNCCNYGLIQSDCNQTSGGVRGSVGGICGEGKDISNCTNYGAVKGVYGGAGGVCGSSSDISNCQNYGAVNGKGSGGVCYSGISISSCSNYGIISGNDNNVGGICGFFTGACTNCTNSGTVTGEFCGMNSYCGVGGICGSCGTADWCSISKCTNSANVSGTGRVWIGGICGATSYGRITNCTNLGAVDYGYYDGEGIHGLGGICGNSGNYGSVSNCKNGGNINSSYENTGGICGKGNSIMNCVNWGIVVSTGEYTGGICGSGKSISNCYNTTSVTGTAYLGGIAGSLDSGSIENCYNIGSISSTTAGNNNVGAIVGSEGAVWNLDTIYGCYYLKTSTVNAELYGCGSISTADIEPEGFFAKSEAALKQQTTFIGMEGIQWDFTNTWAISPNHNGGYPYLVMENELPGDVLVIELTGLILSQVSLSIGIGDTSYLVAYVQPANGTLPELSWVSSDDSVATVNSSGRVTAVGAGTATITVSGGGFSAECTVTVCARMPHEYRIGALTIRDANGAALTSIPTGQFTVTIPVTKLTAGGNTVVFLAAYGSGGQYKGLLYVTVEDVPVGATVKVTLPVNNSKGEITQLKAFPIAAFSNLVPVGAASSFPAQ